MYNMYLYNLKDNKTNTCVATTGLRNRTLATPRSCFQGHLSTSSPNKTTILNSELMYPHFFLQFYLLGMYL